MEKGIWIIDILFEFSLAFVSKTQTSVDQSIFVATSEKKDILRVFYLQTEKQDQCFYAFYSSIDIIAQKQIVCMLDISLGFIICGSSKSIKQPIQLSSLAMNISEYLHWSSYLISMHNILSTVFLNQLEQQSFSAAFYQHNLQKEDTLVEEKASRRASSRKMTRLLGLLNPLSPSLCLDH